jgi:hypothetical protein
MKLRETVPVRELNQQNSSRLSNQFRQIKNKKTMKKYITKLKIAGISTLVAFSLVFSGCESWIDTDMNISPNKPADVPMKFILPSIQTGMAYDLGGNTAVRTTNIWMQYFDGVERQSYAEAVYTLTPSDVNNLWNSLYSSEMKDAKKLIEKAEAEQGDYFAGVAKILLANSVGVTTDLWGDVPFTEAFKGDAGIIQPVFDSQEDIYNYIFTLLEEAIADLSSAENAVPLTNDMIYAGDIMKWKKAAYSLKARYLLNLSKVNGNAAFTDALALIASGFTSNSDDMQFFFGSTSAEASPFYQFMEQRGDIRMASTFVDALNSTSDPRLPFFVEISGAGDYVGSDPGSQNSQACSPGSYLAGLSSPSVFMSYAELKFIEAECEFKVGSAANALAAYKEAVKASVEKVAGAGNSAWLDANINGETTGSLTLNKILYQKYLAQFGTVQSFNDWRRTGVPSLTPAIGATSLELPRRFPYAQEEQSYNENCPDDYNRVWWDVQ